MTKRFFPAAFVVLIFAPLAGLVLDANNPRPNDEQRMLAPKPTFPKKVSDLAPLFPKLEKYIDDHFGFRTQMIRVSRMLTFKVLHQNGSDSVLIGKDGWLFFMGENNLNSYRNTHPFTQHEADAWTAFVLSQKKKAESVGAKFYFIVAPDAHTIYGDRYLPDWVERIPGPSRLDVLFERLKNVGVNFVDPRPLLLKKRDGDQIYQKTDTHWNSLGAFYGTSVLLEKIAKDFPVIKPAALEDFTINRSTEKGGDLTWLLGVTGMRENGVQLTNKAPLPPTSLRAVVYRDSFYAKMQPLFEPYFSKAQNFPSQYLDEKVLQAEKPDVVVLEIVERYLMDGRDPNRH